MKLHIMQFSPVSCYFPLLDPNIFLSTLLSKTLNEFSSIIVRDQESRP